MTHVFQLEFSTTGVQQFRFAFSRFRPKTPTSNNENNISARIIFIYEFHISFMCIVSFGYALGPSYKLSWLLFPFEMVESVWMSVIYAKLMPLCLVTRSINFPVTESNNGDFFVCVSLHSFVHYYSALFCFLVLSVNQTTILKIISKWMLQLQLGNC